MPRSERHWKGFWWSDFYASILFGRCMKRTRTEPNKKKRKLSFYCYAFLLLLFFAWARFSIYLFINSAFYCVHNLKRCSLSIINSSSSLIHNNKHIKIRPQQIQRPMLFSCVRKRTNLLFFYFLSNKRQQLNQFNGEKKLESGAIAKAWLFRFVSLTVDISEALMMSDYFGSSRPFFYIRSIFFASLFYWSPSMAIIQRGAVIKNTYKIDV